MSRIALPPAWPRRRPSATAPDPLRSSLPTTSKAARLPRAASDQAALGHAREPRHGSDANRSDPAARRNPHSRAKHRQHSAG